MSPRSVRVLRLAPVLDFGGVESCMVVQGKYWDDPMITIDFACFWKDGAAAAELREQGHRVIMLGENPSIRNPKATLALLKLLRRERYDVVHSSIGDANFHTMLCGRLGSWKTVIEEAGIPQRRLRNRLIHAVLYYLPDAIVCVSAAGANNILEREWAPEHKVIVLHNAIDGKHFEHVNARAPNRTLFRAVGRLSAVKNFDGLIHAFHEASKVLPDIRLEIVGEGDERSVLADLIKELQLSNKVSLLGYRNDVSELHQTTGWLLAPSHQEGFGLVVAEAMAAGVPVIGSNAGGLPEVFGDLAMDWTLPSQALHRWAERIIDAATMSSTDYLSLAQRVRTNAFRFHPERYVRDLSVLYLNQV